jgi:hypothetical protein
MRDDETLLRIGLAVLALAGALLFAPLVVSVPYLELALALAVLAAYAGAVLIGLSEEGRPV